MTTILDQLRGGLIASCQPVDDGPLDRPEFVAAMAQAAVQAGAAGLRIEGVDNLRAVRPVVDVPIIGIVKTDSPQTPVRITVTTDDVAALVAAGADIVAYDATDRPREHSRDAILAAIQDAGVLAMADCATLSEAENAASNGASILGTTLSGYTAQTARDLPDPDFELINALRPLGCFIMAEGRFDTPDLAAAALRAGANEVTVGSALTRLEVVTSRFVTAMRSATNESQLTGFAVDLGGTKTAAIRLENGHSAERLQQSTDGGAPPDAQVAQMADLLARLGYQRGDPLGVAVTGRVDRSGQWYAVNQQTLAGLGAFPLRRAIAKSIGPAVTINDAAAATLAEHRLGAGRGRRDFAYITVSTGIGGGVILNRQLIQSDNGLAGHIGFTASRDGQDICGCGRRGTVESLASGWAMAKAAQDAGHGDLDAKAIFDLGRSNVDWATALIDRSAQAVSDLAADLVASFGVTQIAIGGSIGLADGYLARVTAHHRSLPGPLTADLVAAQLGGDGPLIGALLAERPTS